MGDDGKVISLEERRRRPRLLPSAAVLEADLPLVDRLAIVLSQLDDEPLMVLPSDGSGARDSHTAEPRPMDLQLSHFKPDLVERACDLLEEAGW